MTDLSHPPTYMTVRLAETICGKLSQTKKMPCKSYSLPTARCVTGSKLSLIEGSVCSKCYAKRDHQIMHTEAQEARWQSLTHPRWVEAITHLIREEGSSYFRWQDCGDLAGAFHLRAIVLVAYKLPHIKFWLPTSEVDLVNEFTQHYGDFPENLVVRVSNTLIDSKQRGGQSNTSSVHRHKPHHGFECQSVYHGGRCSDCRACWDKELKNVSFLYR